MGRALPRQTDQAQAGAEKDREPCAAQPAPDARETTVVVGCFEAVITRGLEAVLAEDERLQVIRTGLEDAALERAVARWTPRVAIVGEAVVEKLSARLQTQNPTTEILVIADDPSPTYARLIVAAGASCVARSSSAQEILAAVHHAALGGHSFTTAASQGMTRRYPPGTRLLTAREIEVLGRISHKQTYAEIGFKLGISPETVRRHAANICRKLDVSNTRDLVGLSVPRLGLIDS